LIAFMVINFGNTKPNYFEFAIMFTFYWFVFTIFLPLNVFESHKEDYISIGADKIEYRIGSKKLSFFIKETDVIEKKRFFIINNSVIKKTKISKESIANFAGRDILLNRFKEIAR